MATLTIRDLDESLKRILRMRADSHNRSMEEEARQILRAALLDDPAPLADLATRIRARFVGLGDVLLDLPQRASGVNNLSTRWRRCSAKTLPAASCPSIQAPPPTTRL
jgi:antitoxin FitA